MPAAGAGIGGGGSSLAADVLQLSGLLAQDGFARGRGACVFSSKDATTADDLGTFELSRDDTLELIGLLNSSELDIAQREFGAMMSRLERPAVEGLIQGLFAALRRQHRELAALEYEAERSTEKPNAARRPTAPGSGGSSTGLPVSQHQRRAEQARQRQEAIAATLASPPPPPRRVRHGVVRSSSDGPAIRPQKDGARQVTRPRVATSTAGSGEPSGSGEVPRGGDVVDGQHQQSVVTCSASTGRLSCKGGLHASAYLDRVIEAHEVQIGQPVSTSRSYALPEDMHFGQSRSPRVSEERAGEIFDRLYKSGKEHRVRRRVYQELGLLVDQAKHEQTCTFVPHVPFAAAAGNGSVTERLYRDGADRRKRREELVQNAPVPSFHPQTLLSSTCLASSQSQLSLNSSSLSRQSLHAADGEVGPHDDSALESSVGAGIDAELTGIGAPASDALAPRYLRLFREYEERQARKLKRQVDLAEWKKHTYRPDIATSQASGPQVMRMFSSASALREDFIQGAEAVVQVQQEQPQQWEEPQHQEQLQQQHHHQQGPPAADSLAAAAVAAAAAAAAAAASLAAEVGCVGYADAPTPSPTTGSGSILEAAQVVEEDSREGCSSPDTKPSDDSPRLADAQGTPGYVKRLREAHEATAAAAKATERSVNDGSFEDDAVSCEEAALSYGGSVAVAAVPTQEGERAPASGGDVHAVQRQLAGPPQPPRQHPSEAMAPAPKSARGTHGSSAGASARSALPTKSAPLPSGASEVRRSRGTPSTASPVVVGPDGSEYMPYVKPPASKSALAYDAPPELRGSIGSCASASCPGGVSREASAATFHSGMCMTPIALNSPRSPTRAYSGRISPVVENVKLVIAPSPTTGAGGGGVQRSASGVMLGGAGESPPATSPRVVVAPAGVAPTQSGVVPLSPFAVARSMQLAAGAGIAPSQATSSLPVIHRAPTVPILFPLAPRGAATLFAGPAPAGSGQAGAGSAPGAVAAPSAAPAAAVATGSASVQQATPTTPLMVPRAVQHRPGGGALVMSPRQSGHSTPVAAMAMSPRQSVQCLTQAVGGMASPRAPAIVFPASPPAPWPQPQIRLIPQPLIGKLLV